MNTTVVIIPAHIRTICNYDCDILEIYEGKNLLLGYDALNIDIKWIQSNGKQYKLKIHNTRSERKWCSCTQNKPHEDNFYNARNWEKDNESGNGRNNIALYGSHILVGLGFGAAAIANPIVGLIGLGLAGINVLNS